MPMPPDPDQCMFCQDGLQTEPVNLAFMDHLEERADCQQAFDAWTTNMQTDWLGD